MLYFMPHRTCPPLWPCEPLLRACSRARSEISNTEPRGRGWDCTVHDLGKIGANIFDLKTYTKKRTSEKKRVLQNGRQCRCTSQTRTFIKKKMSTELMPLDLNSKCRGEKQCVKDDPGMNVSLKTSGPKCRGCIPLISAIWNRDLVCHPNTLIPKRCSNKRKRLWWA